MEYRNPLEIHASNMTKFAEFLLDHEMWLCRNIDDRNDQRRADIISAAYAHTYMIRKEFEKALGSVVPYVPPPKQRIRL